jgi:deoxycytidylate deaminase
MNVARKANRIVEIAYALKPKYATGRSFHVTGIFNKNKIISIGINNYRKTHPKSYEFIKDEVVNEGDYFPSIHSELSAILKLSVEDCSDFTFFNVRIDKNNQINNSRPCSGCVKLLKQVGFNHFFYSDEKGAFVPYL